MERGVNMSIFRMLAIGNYIMVNREIAVKLGLNAAVMLAELANEEQYYQARGELENGWFYSSRDNVEEKIGLKRRKQESGIKDLKDAGLIETKVCGMPAKRFFRLNEDALIELLSDGTKQANFRDETDQQKVQNIPTDGTKDTNSWDKKDQPTVQKVPEKKTYKREQRKENRKKENRIKIYSRVALDDDKQDDTEPADREPDVIQSDVLEVVEYLNSKTGKHYRPNSKSTRRFISGRLHDGATVAEMKAVIDVKAREWGRDPKMKQYLRPETLFNETKFETYRQQINDAAPGDWYNELEFDDNGNMISDSDDNNGGWGALKFDSNGNLI